MLIRAPFSQSHKSVFQTWLGGIDITYLESVFQDYIQDAGKIDALIYAESQAPEPFFHIDISGSSMDAGDCTQSSHHFLAFYIGEDHIHEGDIKDFLFQNGQLDFSGCVAGDYLAFIKDSDAVTDFLGLIQIMGAEHDRSAFFAREFVFHQSAEVRSRGRVKTGSRLIEEQHWSVAE